MSKKIYFDNLHDFNDYKILCDYEEEIYSKSSKFIDNNGNLKDNKTKVIYCHDIAGGYLDYDTSDKNCCPTFRFWRFDLIDIFIYFSHHFISLPPESWTRICHQRNVLVYGTIIFESLNESFQELFLNRTLSHKNISTFIKNIKRISQARNIDGWLINVEVKPDEKTDVNFLLSNMKMFLKLLSEINLKVLWYDSLTIDGKLEWQDKLDDRNYEFYQLSNDGIYLNYSWKAEHLVESQKMCKDASESSKVYVGIDCFGRGVIGDGGWNTNIALDEILSANRSQPDLPLSVALFAPGWCFEKFHPIHTTISDKTDLSQKMDLLAFLDWLFWYNGLAQGIHNLRGNASRVSYSIESLVDEKKLNTCLSLGYGLAKMTNDMILVEDLGWNDQKCQEIYPTCRELNNDPKDVYFITTPNHEVIYGPNSGTCLEIKSVYKLPDLLEKYLGAQKPDVLSMRIPDAEEGLFVPLELFTFDQLRLSDEAGQFFVSLSTNSLSTSNDQLIDNLFKGIFIDFLIGGCANRVSDFRPEHTVLDMLDRSWHLYIYRDLVKTIREKCKSGHDSKDILIRRIGLLLVPHAFMTQSASLFIGMIGLDDSNPSYF